MLQRLIIRNYAIIDELDIRFSEGLNIITGETGAGKSILLGALGLILGERADPGVLFEKDTKCIIEGIFAVPQREALQRFFSEQELDYEAQTIIRREISAAGKSRAFVNDTPVTLQQLSALSRLLVDLHQQFDTLQLERQDFQLAVVDALVNRPDLLESYHELYRAWQSQERQLRELTEQNLQAGKESDYQRFLLEELEEAGFSEQELEDLDAEQNMLSHAEELKNALQSVSFALMEGEDPLLQQLRQLQATLQGIAAFHAKVPELVQRLGSAGIELQDIADELDHISDHTQFDAERIAFVNDRLALGYRLFKKHGVQSTAALLEIKEELQCKLDRVLNLEEEIARLRTVRDVSLRELQRMAAVISGVREKVPAPLEKKVNALLVQVGMPNARLKVSLQRGDLREEGQDTVEFLFDANRTGNFQPVRKVASGGELSRLMLCIKSLVAGSIALPTLIFDEIDTGISGEAARQAGIILKELAQRHQVICITHQPQIAGKADAHYFVYKESRKEKVYTNIRLLEKEERVQAIARMLSGEKPSEAALANARELISD